jgi:hypothetical protein
MPQSTHPIEKTANHIPLPIHGLCVNSVELAVLLAEFCVDFEGKQWYTLKECMNSNVLMDADSALMTQFDWCPHILGHLCHLFDCYCCLVSAPLSFLQTFYLGIPGRKIHLL